MTDKTAPLGICDLCGAKLDDPYTSKGKPRRYCSVDCRNTGNSREGNPERVRKLHESVARGEWVNPHQVRPPTPEEQAARARKGRLREVAEGTWRNPGLTPEAREINSRPHKYSGPLAEAMERLKKGRMKDLTPEQAAAYLAYRQAIRDAMSEEEKEEHRRKRREQYRRRQEKRKNSPPTRGANLP